MANTVSAQISSLFPGLWGLTQPQTCPLEAEWPPYFGRLLIFIYRDATSSTVGWSQDHRSVLAPFSLFVRYKYGVSIAGKPSLGAQAGRDVCVVCHWMSVQGQLILWSCFVVMMPYFLWSPQHPWVVAAAVAREQQCPQGGGQRL